MTRRLDWRLPFRLVWSMVLKRFPPVEPPIVSFDGGRLRLVADMTTAFGRKLYRYGVDEPDLELLHQRLRPGDVFVDGGAHVGLFTLVAAKIVGPEGKVFAFEPHPETFRRLQRNVELNGLRNVHLHPEALGKEEGTARFTLLHGDHAPWSHLGDPTETTASSVVDVRVVSLPKIIPVALWPRVRLIKLDLEGGEVAVLEGARPLLEAVRPDLLLEVVPEHLRRFGASVEDVTALLGSLGYAVYVRSGRGGSWVLADQSSLPGYTSDRPNWFATVRDAPVNAPA